MKITMLFLCLTSLSNADMTNRLGHSVPDYNAADPNLYNNGYADGVLPKSKYEYIRDLADLTCLEHAKTKTSFLKQYNPDKKYHCKELIKFK